MAQYSIEQYYKLGSVSELERRFNLLKELIQPFKAHRDLVRRILDDAEWGRAELEDWNKRLDEVASDMKNIIEAINLLGVTK